MAATTGTLTEETVNAEQARREGRQGRDGRTHLVSPEMAALAAVTGHFEDVREWLKENDRASL